MSRTHREFFAHYSRTLNAWAESCIKGSGWGWTGELCVPAEIAGKCSEEEIAEITFTRGKRWTCDEGVKFDIYYSVVLDDSEAMMSSPEIVIFGSLDE